ncbi:MAG: glycosyltransferase family A protein [Thermoanaerobaculia bacterium]|nr:glycosyltransferase family A protein [Thermoanaerobaculia bacterium]
MTHPSRESDALDHDRGPARSAPCVTTIIPTIGRESLARVVATVLEQDLGSRQELVVVNDSARSLGEAPWMADPRVEVVRSDRQERCVARNRGAELAKGRWLHFLDDDDTLLPGGLIALLECSRRASPGLVVGATQLTDREDHPILRLRHDADTIGFTQAMAGEWYPLGSSLVRADAFKSVGGFARLPVGAEDCDLTRRLLLVADAAHTPAPVARVRMGAGPGSTTPWAEHGRRSRRAREAILDRHQVWPRLWGSATTPYWRGRIARLYWTSVLWNLGHGRFRHAVVRAAFGSRCLARSRGDLFDGSYWLALARAHRSPAFARGFAEAGRAPTG